MRSYVKAIAELRVLPAAAITLLITLLSVACGAAAGGDSGRRLTVVTTTVLLADMARNVAGEGVEVRSLAPAGADVHSFQTTPEDSVAVNRAGVLVSNGAGLDDFLIGVLESARNPRSVHVVASAGLGPHETGDEATAPGSGATAPHTPEDAADHPEGDPHYWQNPEFAIRYVENIRDGLVRADPANAPVYEANAAGYVRQLEDLDREIARILEQVPPERRHLVTFHDAFGHFGRRYGWQVSAFVPSSAGEAAPGDIVRVMERVKAQGLPAVFAEPQFLAPAMDRAARDAGLAVGIIYSDVLDGNAPTYIDMMRANATSLADHLRR